ncbi:MAG: right-handed parallel beta-helix repeat-containing protein [Geminicoccaceae bacterium]
MSAEIPVAFTNGSFPLTLGKEIVNTDRAPSAWQGGNEDIVRGEVGDVGQYEAGLVPRGWGSGRGSEGSPELFFRGHRVPLARWPNDGFATVAAVPDGPQGVRFTVDPGSLPAGLETGAELWAFGYWYYDWAGSFRPVRLLDRGRGLFELGAPGSPYGLKAGQRVRLENHLALLDRPGEWVLDAAAGAIYFWPPESLREGDVELSWRPTLIHIKGASHLRLVGLDLHAVRGIAVLIEDSTDVVLQDCRISGASVHGVVIRGGRGNGVERCSFADIGEEAVVLDGGDRRTLTPGGHFVRNSTFERYGLWQTSAAAVRLAGVGNEVRGNEMRDATGGGVIFDGNDHRVTGNLFHHLLGELGDAGVIYTGRDWSGRGSLVAGNTVCAVRSTWPGGVNGIYLDDTASGIAVVGNRFYDVTRAMLIGGGSDNLILRNLIAAVDEPIVLDARGLGWAKDKLFGPLPSGWDMKARLRAVPWNVEPYASRYPTLPGAIEDEAGLPQRNVLQGNSVDHVTVAVIAPEAKAHQLVVDNKVDAVSAAELRREFPPACFRPGGP